MSDISNLIAELEKAEGPSRDLDIQIGEYLGLCDHSGPAHHRPWRDWARHYTASIDAALTLVPEGPDNNGREGWILSGLEQISAPWRWKVTLIHCAARWRDFEILHQGIAPTAPIALCIAALKARST